MLMPCRMGSLLRQSQGDSGTNFTALSVPTLQIPADVLRVDRSQASCCGCHSFRESQHSLYNRLGRTCWACQPPLVISGQLLAGYSSIFCGIAIPFLLPPPTILCPGFCGVCTYLTPAVAFTGAFEALRRPDPDLRHS
ncbi:hypothetical protein C8R47DRAFT_137794 [Mycena vitilis]|nr:hypothetical protein C8R47DRAFT_137794 [Mycena vitilis]